MNIATKILNKQRTNYISLTIQGIFLVVLGTVIGFKLLTEGLGKSSGKGKSEALSKLIHNIVGDKANPEQVMQYLLVGLMLVVVGAGIFWFIRGMRHIMPKNTPLGKSVVTQAKNYEKLSDLITSINTDLNYAAEVYETVYIGREWILGMEAMRLSRVSGIFWLDEGESEFILCCVDTEQNIWASSFTYKDERDKALGDLHNRFPDIIYGDRTAYISYRKNKNFS